MPCGHVKNLDAVRTGRKITQMTERVCNRLCSTIALQHALQAHMPPSSESRDKHGKDWPRPRCEQHVRVNKTGDITTQLTLHQILKPQHFKISDSNRQALKHHHVANEHSQPSWSILLLNGVNCVTVSHTSATSTNMSSVSATSVRTAVDTDRGHGRRVEWRAGIGTGASYHRQHCARRDA